MIRIRRGPRHRAYTLLVVLVTTFLVLGFALLLGSMVVLEWSSDRQHLLDANAQQVIASARAWSRLHAAELNDGRSVRLPVDDLLPSGVAGMVELRSTTATGGAVIECEVRVERTGRHLTRRAAWPLNLDTRPRTD